LQREILLLVCAHTEMLVVSAERVCRTFIPYVCVSISDFFSLYVTASSVYQMECQCLCLVQVV